MARIRYIKPEFFDDPVLARCSYGARLLFVALWQLSDRLGIFEWDELKLKKYTFGYDEVSVKQLSAMLDELRKGGHVTCVAHGGKMYGHIPSLQKHQKFHRDEPARYSEVACTLSAPSLKPSSSAGNGERRTENGELATENGQRDLPLPPSAEPAKPTTRKRTPQEQASAKLVKDAYLSGYREYYGAECDTWGAPHNAHVYHLLKSSTAEILASKASAYFQWPNKRAIDAGHPFMGHHASFSANLAELTADAIKPDRRKQSAVVDARLRQLDTIAQDDDMLNRMEIQQQLTKDPFDDRQWRTGKQLSVGQPQHSHSGAIETRGDAPGGDSQPQAIGSSSDGMVSSAGVLRGGDAPLASVPSGVRSGTDAVDRIVQAVDAGSPRTNALQTAGAIIRGRTKTL